MHTSPTLPKSETHMGLNLFGMLCGLIMLHIVTREIGNIDIIHRVIYVGLATIIPIVIGDVLLRTRNHPASGIGPKSRPLSIKRVATRYLGLIATLSAIAFFYWLFPVYKMNFYTPFWTVLSWLVPAMLIGAPFYFAWCDTRTISEDDTYLQLGRLCLLQKNYSGRAIAIHFRNWLVKAFFTPLMFIFMMQNVGEFSAFYTIDISQPSQLYAALNNFIYTIDLLFACVGYIMTLRILNSQIRSSEPTVGGWVCALACYSPFWTGLIYQQYFPYNTNSNFETVLADSPYLLIACAASILILTAIYSFATVAMGYRFSNLTYRGLVTCGPYRYCKHPAYVAKNISWWLIALPFISQQGPEAALRNSLLLVGINIIYFMRARTEERHLSNYPEYVAYAEAMNTHSIFAPLARRIPYLQYKKPVNPPRVD